MEKAGMLTLSGSASGSLMMIAQVPTSKTILFVTGEGKIMRGDKQIEELSRDELLDVIREVVGMLCNRQ